MQQCHAANKAVTLTQAVLITAANELPVLSLSATPRPSFTHTGVAVPWHYVF